MSDLLAGLKSRSFTTAKGDRVSIAEIESATSVASRRPLIAISNPLRASSNAMPRPMPRLPPVTSAILRGEFIENEMMKDE